MQYLLSLVKHLRAAPGLIADGWRRDYSDARIILEQNGDLRYLNVSARLQRLMVRGGIVLSLSLLVTLIVLAVTSVTLMVGRQRLERSHMEVYRALLSSTADGEASEVAGLTEEQMVALAQTIRDRDMSIRRFVDTSMVAVTQENVTLKSELDSAGLTEKVVNIIQQNSANGGFALNDDIKSNPLLRGKVSDELATNRSLREVLYALPTRMPVAEYSVTSDFGIRKHPLTGIPHLHTGVDLLSETGNDNVYPVKSGVVVLAETHSHYGNMVVVRHTNGVESLYAHLAKYMVHVGDKVTPETVLGYIGNTGSSTGKHLHLEILVGGYPVNPQKVIRTAKYVQQIQKSQP